MNVVVIGYGSIGKRHTKNLIELGHRVKTIDVEEISNIKSILRKSKFDCGFVCSPSNFHLEHMLVLAQSGIPFFCEKPIYSERNLGLINDIRSLIQEKSLVNMVGCNLRFHPVIKSFDCSRVHNMKVFFGYDLRKWHNDGKHLESYSANKNMGGGVLLDAIHEFDYLYNWFGKIKEISGVKKRIGSVTVDTEDTVKAKVVFACGVVAEVHLDYLQNEYTRYFEAHGIKKHINPTNQMYVDEIRYFMDCVKNKKKCMNDFEEAIYLVDEIRSGGIKDL
jgi:predicted dehydrogenase